MSEAIVDAIAKIARQLAEQLKYYREIGIEDISGSAPQADSKDLDQLKTDTRVIEEAMPKSTHPGQASLFDDLAPHQLPALEAKDASLEAIREDIGECTRCKLSQHRTHIVFGEGNPKAELVFVGEAPGAEEDASGRPFVGRAGQLLDKIISAIGMRREECYIANVVKCRPPQNRTPEPDEVATCEQFLFRQLAFIRPRVIVALGAPALQCLLRTKEPITKARGQWREWNGIKVMPTFHPAYLLRAPARKREVWEDMKKVRDYLRSASR
jgi:uracil-DNA glycosylase family 4